MKQKGGISYVFWTAWINIVCNSSVLVIWLEQAKQFRFGGQRQLPSQPPFPHLPKLPKCSTWFLQLLPFLRHLA